MDELRKHADQMYEVICSALDKKGWQYAKNEEKQQVIFVANAEDVSLSVGIGVDERKQRIYLQLPLDTPSLGNLINTGRSLMTMAPLRYQLYFPVIVLAVITVSFYIIGNAFADAADPKNHV